MDKVLAFPQPNIYAFGYVTSAGAQDLTRFFLPTEMSVTKTGTGVYKISHKIGYSNRYTILATPVDSAAKITGIYNINADDVEVRTFDQAGTATDTAFTFVIFIL
jgi:hypothetical protein